MLRKDFRFVSAVRLLSAALALALPLAASAQTVQKETKSFTATVTSFQTYIAGQANHHYIALAIHFRNNTDKAVILGLNRDGTKASDEQGNRYDVVQAYGIGSVSGSDVDPKFVLPAHGAGDAHLVLLWKGNSIFGVTFDLNLAVKELSKLTGGQYQIGPESVLGFEGLKTGLAVALENAPEISQHVVQAGPFNARITHSKFGKGSYSYPIAGDFTVQLENKSDKPLVLAVEHDSITGIDDEGNYYGGVKGPGGYANATGIGEATKDQADPQFVLAPGEVKEFHITIGRSRAKTYGSEFVLNFALDELEILPSKQIREVRQYSVTFPKIRM